MLQLEGFLSPTQTLCGELSPSLHHMEGNLTVPVRIDRERYNGSLNIVPSATEQVIATDGKWVDGDITVAPIPSNYGRIIWNGADLQIV